MKTFPANISLAELEQILLSRKQQLEDLHQKKAALQTELAQVEEEITKMQGDRVRKSSPAGTRNPRAQNERSLREFVVEILGQSRKGLSLSELTAKVLEAGYRTESNNFRNVLYQCLYNTKDVYHDDATGTYRLKSLQSQPVR